MILPRPVLNEGTETKLRLLNVAVEHFGQFGLKGTSTRAVAAAAGSMMSSITYHFGSKEGLYLATAHHVADVMRGWMAPAIEQTEAGFGGGSSQAKARQKLHLILERAAEVLNTPETESVARFILKEQTDPGRAFTVIYEGAMSIVHERIVALLLEAVGNRISEREARVRSLAMFGQLLIFRTSRALVFQTNTWSTIGPQEISIIKSVIRDHLDAALDQILSAGSSGRPPTDQIT